jgi:hypothetical protein
MNASTDAPNSLRRVAAGRGASWLVESLGLFMREPGTWIGINLVYMLIGFVVGLAPGGFFVTSLFGPVFSGGLILGCYAEDSGERLKFEHLFAGFKGQRLGSLLLLALLYLGGMLLLILVCTVLVITGLGLKPGSLRSMVEAHAQLQPLLDSMLLPVLLLALIAVALYIPLAMGMWLAPALVVLRGLGPGAAFALSFRACMINFLPFLVYGLVALLMAVVAGTPLLVAAVLGFQLKSPLLVTLGCVLSLLVFLVMVPVLAISIYTAYRDMLPGPASSPAPSPDRLPPPAATG